jgi:hypothetical protein
MKTNVADRELLELASKASAIALDWDGPPDEWQPLYYEGKTYHYWNPLTDDGDAMRLAVKLSQLDGGLALLLNSRFGSVSFAQCFTNENVVSPDEHMQDDPYAATRRAITRAAAEIGKASHEEASS